MEHFGEFTAHFRPDFDESVRVRPPRDPLLEGSTGHRAFTEVVAGQSFNGGAYRAHDAESAENAKAMVVAAFPEIAESVSVPFGYDWMGRQFALDSRRRDRSGEPLVVLCQPGTGQVLDVPAGLLKFHDVVLVEEPEAAFEADLFASWSRANPDAVPLALTTCVGYTVPPFLGGEHSISNLELIDLDVYWSIIGQLRAKVRDLPLGTSIRSVTIE
jgi:hypothetical protein